MSDEVLNSAPTSAPDDTPRADRIVRFRSTHTTDDTHDTSAVDKTHNIPAKKDERRRGTHVHKEEFPKKDSWLFRLIFGGMWLWIRIWIAVIVFVAPLVAVATTHSPSPFKLCVATFMLAKLHSRHTLLSLAAACVVAAANTSEYTRWIVL